MILPLLLFLILITQRQLNHRTQSMRILFPYLLLAVLYLYIRWRVISIHELFGHLDGSIYLTMLTMARALLHYMWALIVPFHLTVNHALGSMIPSFMVEVGDAFPTVLTAIRAQSIAHPPQLAAIGILLVAGMIIVKKWKTYPLLPFAIAWFFVSLIPVSNIIPGHTLMAERYLYVPSLGFCLILAIAVARAFDIHKTRMQTLGTGLCVLILIIMYMSATLQRNTEWKNDLTLWTSATERNPYSYIAFVALGRQYLEQKNYDKAADAYIHILTLFPEQKRVVGFLTQLYISQHRYQDAIELVQTELLRHPKEAETWIKLGDIYRVNSDEKNAMAAYAKAIEIDPTNQTVNIRMTK